MYKSGKIIGTKHKIWEVEIGWIKSTDIFDFWLHWDRKNSRFDFSFEILNFNFSLKIFDNKHWEYKKVEIREIKEK